MKNKIVSSVEGFVRALDECNFEQAGRFLASGCRYFTNPTELVGPEAILQSYADSAKWAEAALERVVYESVIQERSEQTFVVLYTDRIFHAGLEHVYQCRQSLSVNDRGEIEQIRHEDIPGQPEALKAFFERCGIQRS